VESIRQQVPYFANSTLLSALVDSKQLTSCNYASPFSMPLDNSRQAMPLLPSEHVSTKQGTGLVHIAPALGHDDFKLAIKHGLSTECVIDELGRYESSSELLRKYGLAGKQATAESTLNEVKLILNESDALVHEHLHTHSYPYDWRTKKPVIIRSSTQWFIDTNKIKVEALEALKNVKLRPNNVANSMISTISARPYWCISRQRAWGLPIPCFYEKADLNRKTPIINKELINTMKSLLMSEGDADFWWSGKHDKVLFNNEEQRLVKSNDIFDIWFDSGSSFLNLNSDKTTCVADLYCEGVDQFSGLLYNIITSFFVSFCFFLFHFIKIKTS
jgi:isoleucyl-tRNA synthetase